MPRGLVHPWVKRSKQKVRQQSGWFFEFLEILKNTQIMKSSEQETDPPFAPANVMPTSSPCCVLYIFILGQHHRRVDAPGL